MREGVDLKSTQTEGLEIGHSGDMRKDRSKVRGNGKMEKEAGTGVKGDSSSPGSRQNGRVKHMWRMQENGGSL
jgi:hypothetical protein